MKYLVFIYHLILFFIKLLFYIVLLPIFFIWLFIKRKRFLCTFSKELKKYGLEKTDIKELKKHTYKLSDLFIIMKNKRKTLS